MKLRKNLMAVALIAGLATLTPSGSAPLAGSDRVVKIRDGGRVRIVTSADQDGDRDGAVRHVFVGSGAFLGVRLDGDDTVRTGARIEHVIADTPADRAGLRDGDVIVGLDGLSIDGPADLVRRLRELEPGDRADVRVERDGRSETLSVELGERQGARAFHFKLGDHDEFDAEQFGERMRELGEKLGRGLAFDWDHGEGFDAEQFGERMRELGERLGHGETLEWDHLEGIDAEDLNERMRELGERLGDMNLDRHLPNLEGLQHFSFGSRRMRLGVQLIATTPELREHLGGSPDAGVLVGRVVPDTPAEAAGVRVGDLIVAVDDETIESHEDLHEALADRVGETLELRLVRDGRELRLEVELEAEATRPSGGRLQPSGRHRTGNSAAAKAAVRIAHAAARTATGVA